MIYYSTLINVQHSPKNHIGYADSPVYIENLRLESRIGGLLLVTNGYAALDNKATWMGVNGCTGNVHIHINGLDLSEVGIKHKNVILAQTCINAQRLKSKYSCFQSTYVFDIRPTFFWETCIKLLLEAF